MSTVLWQPKQIMVTARKTGLEFILKDVLRPLILSSAAQETHTKHTRPGKCLQRVMSHLQSCLNLAFTSADFWQVCLCFNAVVVCHLKRHCQVFLARVCDWISKSSLAALLSLTVSSTHTHTLLNLDPEMTHSFHSLHRCLLLAFPPQAFRRG